MRFWTWGSGIAPESRKPTSLALLPTDGGNFANEGDHPTEKSKACSNQQAQGAGAELTIKPPACQRKCSQGHTKGEAETTVTGKVCLPVLRAGGVFSLRIWRHAEQRAGSVRIQTRAGRKKARRDRGDPEGAGSQTFIPSQGLGTPVRPCKCLRSEIWAAMVGISVAESRIWEGLFWGAPEACDRLPQQTPERGMKQPAG